MTPLLEPIERPMYPTTGADRLLDGKVSSDIRLLAGNYSICDQITDYIQAVFREEYDV